MRIVIALALVVATGLLSGTPAEACSVRGQYCNYPNWASSAFSGRHARTPPYAILSNGNGGFTTADTGQRPYKRKKR